MSGMIKPLTIRLGYVAMSLMLENASPSQTITVKNLEKMIDKQAAIRRLERISRSNLDNCLRLLKHNKAYDISFFRLSSRLVPLVNHPLTEGWVYERSIASKLKEIGELVKESKMRIDFHPDHFVVLNSRSKEVFRQSLKALLYHYKLLKGMGISPVHRCVLHIGGKKEGKEAGLEQFIANFSNIPRPLQQMIMIENDDVSYTVEDALYLGEKLDIPVVLDLHHFDVHHTSMDLPSLWARILQTWKYSPLPIKIHISSPKEGEGDRRHHDFIQAERFYHFLAQIAGTVSRIDVMIEAKKKDIALLKLVQDLQLMPQIQMQTQASFTYLMKEV